ncbi:MAG: amidohydrolase family protein [Candidatus Coatesbacteria bacterium]
MHAHVCLLPEPCRGEPYRTFPEVIGNLKRSMQANGIDHTILIPDNKDGGAEMPGLAQLMELLRGETCFSYLGCPNILQEQPGDLARFRDLLVRGVVKGLKFFPGHDPFHANDARCDPYFGLCQELGVPVIIHSANSPSHPPGRMNGPCTDPALIVEVARRFPNLHLGIAHFYWPKFEYCRETVEAFPNIFIDLSGVVDDDEIAGRERVREPLLKLLARDPRRVVFGTDWMECDTAKHVAMVEALPVDDKIKEMIFSENARRIYRLDLAT